MFEEFQKQRARNVVRQIPNQLHAAMCEKNAWIELQRISVDDFESLILEARTQKRCKSSILFDRQNLGTFFKNKFGQGAQARTDFDDIIFRLDMCLIDDPAGDVLIVQKVLTESLDR